MQLKKNDTNLGPERQMPQVLSHMNIKLQLFSFAW